jgi:hypothetical protein
MQTCHPTRCQMVAPMSNVFDANANRAPHVAVAAHAICAACCNCRSRHLCRACHNCPQARDVLHASPTRTPCIARIARTTWMCAAVLDVKRQVTRSLRNSHKEFARFTMSGNGHSTCDLGGVAAVTTNQLRIIRSIPVSGICVVLAAGAGAKCRWEGHTCE